MADYYARVVREGTWWVIHVHNVGTTQAKLDVNVETMARDLIACADQIDPDSFSLELQWDEFNPNRQRALPLIPKDQTYCWVCWQGGHPDVVGDRVYVRHPGRRYPCRITKPEEAYRMRALWELRYLPDVAPTAWEFNAQ